ncbi:hypothetical protein HDU96_007091 [Phlyctochytrium bullatum]|nr:hypothetical protein HDU96_007091 [Phlyctochytrium bullatum]
MIFALHHIVLLLIALPSILAQFSPTITLFHANRSCPAPRLPNPIPAPDRAAALAAVPSIGAPAGQTPPCTGDRFSDVKPGVRIPCMCPPSQDVFNEQYVLDHGAEIKTDGSLASQRFNLERAIISLQNSFCCPAAAVTFNAQILALKNGGAALPPPPPPPPPAQTSTPSVPTGFSSTITLFHANRSCPAPRLPNPIPAPDRAAALAAVPSIGAPGGQIPPCTGDRFSDVKPGVRIPCMCPPSQYVFNEQYLLDHGADIKTDGSLASQRSNLEKAIISLQNSFCCPGAAVTFNAQILALNNGGAAPPPPPLPPAQTTTPTAPTGFSSTITLFHANRSCPAPRLPNPIPAPDRAAALAAVPSIGAPAGQTPPYTGDRFSDVKPGVRIPCMCPPSQDVFNEQYVLDHGAEIKTDGSVASRRSNLEKAIISLQNSFCCPAAAVTFNAQLLTL